MTDDNIERSEFERQEERMTEYRNRWLDAKSQIGAEGWFSVVRDGPGTLDARPIDRQDDREEGERIETDEWLIREPTGDTYTVTDAVFEHQFSEASAFHTRYFEIDLSWDPSNIDDDSAPVVSGADCYLIVEARIHVPSDTVVSMDVESVHYGDASGDETVYDGIPLEYLYDSDRVTDCGPMGEQVDVDSEGTE